MAVTGTPRMVTDGLVLCLDAANVKSYPGSGTTWTDLSGTQDSTVLINGPTFNTSGAGSFVFDNTDDYTQVSSSAALLSLQVPMTICVWAIPTTFDSNDTIIGQYGGTLGHKLIKMIRLDSGKFRYFTSSTGGGWQYVEMTNTPTLNTWNFFAVSVSGTISSATPTLFLNATSQSLSFSSALSSTPDTTVPIVIGRSTNPGSTSENFGGNISNVLIYNRALSTTEILQNYEATRERFGV